MSYEIYLPQTFQRCIKRLKKRFPRIKDDFSPLFESLQENPQIGDPIPGWNRKAWQIRISSRDLKRGKGRAFRVIYAWTSGNEFFTRYSFILREKREMLRKLKSKHCSRNCSLSWSKLIKLPRETTFSRSIRLACRI